MEQLEDALRPCQVFESMAAELSQRGVRREMVARQVVRRLGDQYLPAMPDGQKMGDTIERRAEVVSFACLRGAGVHGHPYLERGILRPRFHLARTLRRECSRHGVWSRRKGGA